MRLLAGYVRRVLTADRQAALPVAQAQTRIGWDWVQGTTPGSAARVA